MRQKHFGRNSLEQITAIGISTLLIAGYSQAQQPSSPPQNTKPAGGTRSFRVTPMPGHARFRHFQRFRSPAIPTGKDTLFSFDFRGADIINILKFFSQVSNTEIVADPSLSGQATIINPKPVNLDQAFLILQQVLAVRGFTAIQNKDVITIMPFATAAKSTPLLNPGLNPNGPTLVDPRDQVMTQVIPVQNVDAESLAKDLQPLINTGASLIGSSDTNALVITDTASNVQRFIALVASLDKASSKTELRTYPLRKANAKDIADIINNLYKQMGGAVSAPGPGQPGFNPGQPQQAAAEKHPSAFAVADDRTNSVLVVASPDNQERIATDIIARLDGDETNVLTTQIRRINYANATDIANMVNTVLSNQYAGGGAKSENNASFQQRAFGRFAFFGGNNNQNQNQQSVVSSDPFGKVVADDRTNSVLITASADRMQTVNRLIDALDQKVPTESTTFVFPLKNANASDVAYALGQAFNTGQQNNAGFFNTFNITGGAGQVGLPKISRQLGSTSSPFGRSVPPAPPNSPDGSANGTQGVPGYMTSGGFVPANPGSSQNTASSTDQQGGANSRQFFGRFGQQQGIGTGNGPQYGRGRNGNFSSLLQLQNNVFVTASPTGDSVIVTTTPDNYDAVKKLIEQIDVVPRQVMVKMIVAEVTLSKDQKLGFALNGIFQKLFGKANTASGQVGLQAPGFNTGASGTSLDPLAEGAQFVINAANYNGLLQALENDNQIKVVATPQVFTSDGQEALVDVTTNIPYISGQTVNGVSNFISNTILTIPVGYQIDVTPLITSEGLVTVDAVAQASNLEQFETLGSGSSASQYPVVDHRNIDTYVTIQSGQTVAIGGLIQNSNTITVNKVPLLSEIPLIGQFFRSREKVTNRTELVIFITPTVISSLREAGKMTQEQAVDIIKELPVLKKEGTSLSENPAQQKAPANVKK